MYFARHKLNKVDNVRLRIGSIDAKNYDAQINLMLSQDVYVLTPQDGDPCKEGFPDSNLPESLGLYIDMKSTSDYDTWLALAKCWKIWDLDVRGFHKR